MRTGAPVEYDFSGDFELINDLVAVASSVEQFLFMLMLHHRHKYPDSAPPSGSIISAVCRMLHVEGSKEAAAYALGLPVLCGTADYRPPPDGSSASANRRRDYALDYAEIRRQAQEARRL